MGDPGRDPAVAEWVVSGGGGQRATGRTPGDGCERVLNQSRSGSSGQRRGTCCSAPPPQQPQEGVFPDHQKGAHTLVDKSPVCHGSARMPLRGVSTGGRSGPAGPTAPVPSCHPRPSEGHIPRAAHRHSPRGTVSWKGPAGLAGRPPRHSVLLTVTRWPHTSIPPTVAQGKSHPQAREATARSLKCRAGLQGRAERPPGQGQSQASPRAWGNARGPQKALRGNPREHPSNADGIQRNHWELAAPRGRGFGVE